MSTISDQIVLILKEVLQKPAALHEPFFIGNEWKYIKECLDTNYVSSIGKFVGEFETRIAAFTGAAHAIAVVNGTAGLHISLLLAGVKAEDEVLIPTLTFVATANAVAYCDATPHFVDSEWRTLGISPEKLEEYLKKNAEIRRDGLTYNKRTGRCLRACIPVHVLGQPAELEPLVKLCNKYNIVMIEDAAGALGSLYRQRHVGNLGFMGVISFNGNKIVTTGGGGIILTQDEVLAKKAKHITTTAKVSHLWDFVHDQTAYNYRMPNLNAALGCAQLEKLPFFLKEKRLLREQYQRAFEHIPGIRCFTDADGNQSNCWLNAIILEGHLYKLRDEILKKANESGISTRPVWALMHTLKMYEHCPKMDLSTAEEIRSRMIELPSSVFLAERLKEVPVHHISDQESE